MKPTGSNLCSDTRRYKYFKASQKVYIRDLREFEPFENLVCDPSVSSRTCDKLSIATMFTMNASKSLPLITVDLVKHSRKICHAKTRRTLAGHFIVSVVV